MNKKISQTKKVWPAWMERQLVKRGIYDERVLQVFDEMPRQHFVQQVDRGLAQEDMPLQIGEGQTVSQPYVVALTLQAASPAAHEKALEIGAGSGWQAALLGRLCREVHALEVRTKLFLQAKLRMESLGCDNVTLHLADGRKGWPAAAPYDVIISAACTAEVPAEWLKQLRPGGRLVLPLGNKQRQHLLLLKNQSDGSIKRTVLASVRFVSLVSPQQAEQC